MSAELEQLRRDLAAEVLELNEKGLCGCGCGAPLDPGGNGRKRYVLGHRQRAHRRRLELEARVRGVPARLSLRALDAADTTGKRHGDAPAPRKPRPPRHGVSVYFPTPRLAEVAAMAAAGDPLNRVAGDELLSARDAILKALERRNRKGPR